MVEEWGDNLLDSEFLIARIMWKIFFFNFFFFTSLVFNKKGSVLF